MRRCDHCGAIVEACSYKRVGNFVVCSKTCAVKSGIAPKKNPPHMERKKIRRGNQAKYDIK